MESINPYALKLVNVCLFSDFSADYYRNIKEMKKAADGPSRPKEVRGNEGPLGPLAGFFDLISALWLKLLIFFWPFKNSAIYFRPSDFRSTVIQSRM